MAKADPKDKDAASNGEQPVKVRRKPGRVPVSCAECRRLKLKCDRKVPCETCVKRGCSAICPEGSLTTGNRSNRLAFADAEELQKKVERLRARVKVLEDALRHLQADVSDVPHPLLVDIKESESAPDPVQATGISSQASPSVMSLPTPPEVETPPATGREDETFIGAFGTLTLGLRGESRYYGSTARPEFLIHAPRYNSWTDVDRNPINFPRLSQKSFDEAVTGYEVPLEDQDCTRQVFQLLPSLSHACHLCDIYLEHGDYLWYGIPRSQLYDEILGVIYRSASYLAEFPDPGVSSLHAVSVLYMVFALATLFDKDHSPYSYQAQEYFLLSRLALRCSSPLIDTTLWSIQSLIYQTIFMTYSADSSPAPHFISHYAWIHLGFAVKLGNSIGLHVKSSKWQLDEEASQRRSAIFWQLVVQDAWHSFTFGRPPCINLEWVDCELPKDPDERVDSDGHPEWGFHLWTAQFTKLLHTVMSTAFAARVPAYAKVLELDRKIRDFPVPWSMQSKCGLNEDAEPSKTTHMHRFLCMALKEIILLNLHRPYFAQALNEEPQDLLKHRYAPSVLAIYRSAWRLIEALRETHKRVPFVIERYGWPWSTALSAGIVMCLIVTRAPTSSFAPASLHELDRLVEVFQRCASPGAPVAAKNFEIVQKLQTQAHEAASRMEHQDRSSPALSELDRLGGKTQLLASDGVRVTHNIPSPTSSSTSSRGSDHPSNTEIPSSNLPNATSSFGPASLCSGVQENLHPIIVSDLHTFEGISAHHAIPGTSMRTPIDDFNFDLAQPFPLPLEPHLLPDYQPLQDVSAYFGQDYYAMANPAAQGMQQHMSTPQFTPSTQHMGTPDLMGMPMTAPVLDATWQSFVEQLGF